MRILCISPQEVYFAQRLKQEAKTAQIKLDIFSAPLLAEMGFNIDVNNYDCLYVRFCSCHFFKIISLARKFAALGKPVVDFAVTSGSIGINKLRDSWHLAEAGLPQPKTSAFLEAKAWQYPCMLKWNYGFGGKDVFLVQDVGQLHRATEFLPAQELVLQEFIDADFEYKVVTVGYKSLPVILRFNISKTNYRPDFDTAVPIYVGAGNKIARQVVNLAEQASRVLNRELCKIDILQKGDQFYILEVNRWPGLKSFEELTGHNAVKVFLQYLIAK